MSSVLLVGLAFISQTVAKQPPLIEAIKMGDQAAVKRLLSAGADPNMSAIVTAKPSASEGVVGGTTATGETALQLATHAKTSALVKLLLSYKADPNRRGPYDWTPLMSACQRTNAEIVSELLKAGANPNLHNSNGDTAIIFAANTNQTDMIRDLVKAGADMNGGTGQSALIIAAQCGATESVKLLLKLGANPNFRRSGYWTPLEYALNSHDDEIAAILKKAGAKARPLEILRKEIEAGSIKARLAFEERIKAAAVKNAAFSKIHPDDSSVLEAVLIDHLASMKARGSIEGNLGTLTLVDHTSGSTNEYTESQMNYELDEQQAISIDIDMRTDMLRRNSAEVSLESMRFAHAHIGLGQMPARGAGTWVSVYLPGYSKDHNKAFVRLSFGPTAHGASATYFLARNDGKWAVVWRDFAYYA